MQGLRLHEIALVVHACHQSNASRFTNCIGKCVFSQHAFIGQSIDLWCGYGDTFKKALRGIKLFGTISRHPIMGDVID